jgi:amino acid adenylation domain-containing protein
MNMDSERISRRARGGPVPLSFAQQRIWLVDQLSPGSAAYNVPIALRLRGPLDGAALRASVRSVIQRHEALRTTFASIDGVPHQVIDPEPRFDWDERDLPADTDAPALRQEVTREARQSFDLARGPLVRATLWRLGEQDHALLLNLHHIVSDGWSMAVFARELGALYRARVEGGAPALPELPIQYADFAVWQREHLRGAALDEQLTYWKDRLTGVPTLNLPTDRPRPPVQTFRGSHQSALLPRTLLDRLSRVARREHCTLFMAGLAAFAVLLHRYSGQRDVVVATPIANRDRPEVGNLIGFFVNTLPVRIELGGDPTFAELLRAVRDETFDAYEHQSAPFEKLVEALERERDPSRPPLVQVLFSLTHGDARFDLAGGLAVEPVPFENGVSKFDLSLAMEVRDDGLLAVVEHSTDLFDPETIGRALGHLSNLLDQVAADPDRRLSDLSLLTAGERRLLLGDRVSTPAEPLAELCIHQAFEAQAARTPDAVAVVFPALGSGAAADERLTYGELNERANRLARHLRERGIGPGAIVGIFVDRSPDLVVALLATLKAGGAYVPLSPDHPAERLAFLLADTRPAIVLTQRHLEARLPGAGAAVLCVDTAGPLLAAVPGHDLAPLTTPDDRVVVIYTSGSTGTPKGAELTGRGYLHLFRWYRELMGLDADTRFLLMLSFVFDMALKDIVGTLLSGGRVVLAPPGQPDPTTLLALVAEHGVTALSTTPTLLYPLLDLAATADYAALTSLRCINVGGEATQLARVRPWFGSPRCQCRFLHAYGPTECSDVTSFDGPLTPDEVCGAEKLLIGPPLPHVRAYVLDPRRDLQPVGVPGELCIAGVGLAWGYRNRPDLTADRFVPDPFVPAGRMYRTGDVARWAPDGRLELLGRVDRQVKIRGLRIEPAEIEAALQEHPSVRDVVVTVHEDAGGDRRLVAYLVFGAGPVPEAELRQHVRRRLPEYMMPFAFVPIERMPMLSIGKVDHRALPAPDVARSRSAEVVPPRDSVEVRLVRIWEELLNVHPIGVTDDFFALGGHSLLAMQLIAQVAVQFRQNLPMAALFREGTIEKQARRLRMEAVAEASPLVPIQPRGSLPPLFCVHPVGGHVLSYLELAGRLGAEQPLYGLQAPGLESDEPPLASVEAMAERYVACIRGVQEQGPYRIGGWSFGGIVAFEMARQLRERGERVALLALLDSHLPGRDLRWPEDGGEAMLAQFAWELRRGLGLPDRPASAGPADELGSLLAEAQAAALLPPDADGSSMRRLFAVFQANFRAVRAYRPAPYPGPATLLRAGRTGDAWTDPAIAWAALVEGGLDVRDVPGDHHSLLRAPHVEAVAAALAERLAAGAEQVALS